MPTLFDSQNGGQGNTIPVQNPGGNYQTPFYDPGLQLPWYVPGSPGSSPWGWPPSYDTPNPWDQYSPPDPNYDPNSPGNSGGTHTKYPFVPDFSRQAQHPNSVSPPPGYNQNQTQFSNHHLLRFLQRAFPPIGGTKTSNIFGGGKATSILGGNSGNIFGGFNKASGSFKF